MRKLRLAGGEKLKDAWREFKAREGAAKASGVKKRRKRKSALTSATVRDMLAMDRAFREAVTE